MFKSLVTSPSFDSAVALLLTTDLTPDEVLGLRRCDVYSGAVLVTRSTGKGRRSILLSDEARAVFKRLAANVYDPDAPVITQVQGRIPTAENLLYAVGDHIEVLRSMRQTDNVRQAIRRLARVVRQALFPAA